MEKNRCDWATKHQIEKDYHDNEWGIPSFDDYYLFEMLILEGMQAGLSWLTVLNKRDNFRQAFDDFDYNKIINYDDKKIAELLDNVGIIRNKLKINAVVTNAKSYLMIINEFGSFSEYLWSFVDHKPIINNYQTINEVPVSTKLSDQISKDLKKRGFKFIGTTIVYAYLQAVGVIDDHIAICYKRM